MSIGDGIFWATVVWGITNILAILWQISQWWYHKNAASQAKMYDSRIDELWAVHCENFAIPPNMKLPDREYRVEKTS